MNIERQLHKEKKRKVEMYPETVVKCNKNRSSFIYCPRPKNLVR